MKLSKSTREYTADTACCQHTDATKIQYKQKQKLIRNTNKQKCTKWSNLKRNK